VASDNTIYATTDAGSIYAVSSSGQQKWQVKPGAGKPIRAAATVGADGTVYVGTDEGRLFALDPANGSTKWSFGTGGPITAAPTVGANGVIYLGSNDGKLYVLTPGGQALTQFQANAGIDQASPALGADGTLYIGTRGGTLYALKGEALLPATPTAGPAPTAGPSTGVAAPPGFSFVRCSSGKVYALNADGTIGALITDPAVIGSSPIFQASEFVPAGFIDAICGPGR
jgi:outer membrane protein assembly factor BamB